MSLIEHEVGALDAATLRAQHDTVGRDGFVMALMRGGCLGTNQFLDLGALVLHPLSFLGLSCSHDEKPDKDSDV